MNKFRRTTGRQGSLFTGRRAKVLIAGMALLLTSGLAGEANAAAKPAHNHFITFTPTSPAPASYTAEAQLFDGGGKLIYPWKKDSKGSKSIKWGFYSEDPKAYIQISLQIRSNVTQEFKSGRKSSVCDHQVTFSTTNIQYQSSNCK